MLRSIVISFLLFLSAAVAAQTPDTTKDATVISDKIDFEISPDLFHMSGKTQYSIEQSYTTMDTAGQSITVTSGSLLEFPLDVFMIGGVAGIHSSSMAPKFWSVTVGYHTNLSDPNKVMKDSDYLTIPGYFSGNYSYTESDAQMDLTMFQIEAAHELFDIGAARIGIVTGFNYQKITQNVVGYSGWYYDSNYVRQNISGTEPAIDYEVTYKGPKLGFLSKLKLNDNIEIGLKNTASLSFVKDFDDHLLRLFHTFSDGNGIGILNDLNVRCNLNSPLAGKATFVDFVGSFDYYKANITQTFEQYGDAGPNEKPVGTKINGLPHEIESNQFRFGVRLGCLF